MTSLCRDWLTSYRYSAHLHVETATAEMDKLVICKPKNEEILDSLPESSEPCTSRKTPSDQSRKRCKYQE